MVTGSTRRLSWSQIAAWRLSRHHLHARAPRAAMLQVVSDLAGLHAQLMSSAQLTLWARVENLAREDVDRAIWVDRTLFKTWAMRGTLHLLPSSQLGLWISAFDTYTHYRRSSWLRSFGITADQLRQVIDSVAQALDGAMLTREELAQQVAHLTGSAELGDKLRESWGALLKPAAFGGQLCFAPSSGQLVRFTRPDRWVGSWERQDADEALREVTRRFLAGHGPATREDYARWWGTQPAAAQRLMQGLGEEVEQVEVDGKPAWMLSGHPDSAAAETPSRSVRLLPAFDQYVIAATLHAHHLMAGPFKERIYRSQGWLSPVVLVGGRMDGVWRHERKGARLVVQVEPLVDLPRWAREGVAEEAERLARFMSSSLELEWQG